MKKYIQILSAIFFLQSSFSYAQPIVYFGHGLGGYEDHAKLYASTFPGCQMSTFNFPDAQNNYKDKKLISAGQDNDVQAFIQNIKNNPGQKGDKKILMGVSRGAICVSNLFNRKMKKKYKHEALLQSVNGIILESPAARIQDGVDHELKRFGAGWVPYLGSIVDRFFVKSFFYGGYNPAGPHPIDSIQEIPKDLPVLFICTEEDCIIPASSTVRLAHKLVDSGHKQVYLFVYKKGSHGHMIGSRYKKYVKAFLQKCGVNQKKGDKKILDKIKFSCNNRKSLEKLYDLNKRLRRSNWEKYSGRNSAAFLGCIGLLALASLYFLR